MSNYSSISSNLIYGIHCSYYSILISLSIENLFIICWLHCWYSNVLPYIYFTFNYISLFILLILWLSISLWLVDFLIESFIALTTIEQLALIVGIKSLLLSELMLFFACFWCYINFRLIGSILLLIYFPLLSCYSFSIPFANLLILLFSSLPIQCSQIFIKIGFLNMSIEGLGQSPSVGFYSIILQCKEFSYSYFSLTDCVIGSIHYFTTGLHGFHVLLGSFLFYIIIFIFFIYAKFICFFFSGFVDLLVFIL